MSEDRNVECYLCGREMFFCGDPRWQAEVEVTVKQLDERTVNFYAHAKCWSDVGRRWNAHEWLVLALENVAHAPPIISTIRRIVNDALAYAKGASCTAQTPKG